MHIAVSGSCTSDSGKWNNYTKKNLTVRNKKIPRNYAALRSQFIRFNHPLLPLWEESRQILDSNSNNMRNGVSFTPLPHRPNGDSERKSNSTSSSGQIVAAVASVPQLSRFNYVIPRKGRRRSKGVMLCSGLRWVSVRFISFQPSDQNGFSALLWQPSMVIMLRI